MRVLLLLLLLMMMILRLKLRLLASRGRLVAAREWERARERKRAATAAGLSGSSGSLSLRALLPVCTRSVSVRAAGAAHAVTCAVSAPAARTCTCRGVLLQQHLWLGAAFAWRRHELEERLAVFEVDCWRRRSLLLLLRLHAARHNDVVSAALRRNVEHRERCLRPHAAATAGRGRRGLRNVRFGPPASRHPLTRLLLLLLSTHWLASGKCLLLLLLQEVALHQCVHECRLR